MKAKDIMSEEVFSINADESIWEALNIMSRAEIRHVPVLSDDRVVGMISDRDVRSFEVPYDESVKDPMNAIERLEQSVSGLVERELISVHPESSLSEVIEVMLAEKVGALVVVDPASGSLEGVVSYIDILGAVQSIVDRL